MDGATLQILVMGAFVLALIGCVFHAMADTNPC
jgi:hypothetical protein